MKEGIWSGGGSVAGNAASVACGVAGKIVPVARVQLSYCYGESDVFYTISQYRTVCV
jgi:hypothetical protein